MTWLSLNQIASAETANSITGRVTDQTGGVLLGVSVELTAADRDFELRTVTEVDGSYRLDNVPSGPSTITFRLINFSTAQNDVEIISGKLIELNVSLTLQLTASVVITGLRTFRDISDLENPQQALLGIASSASVGAITAREISSQIIHRPAEVLESVPGLILSQHSGEGKATQYYLRGFNLDHGSDFKTTLIDLPMNNPAGAHSHGYTDINLLIPELVSGVQFTKGPYFAEHGDFSVAGTANITYLTSLDRPLLKMSIGGQGWKRVLSAVSPSVGQGSLLLGLELSANDGPWVHPDGLKKQNGIIRYSRGDRFNSFSLTGLGHSSTWNATDQIPRRAIGKQLSTQFDAIDPTDGGRSSRYALTFSGLRSKQDRSTRFNAYVMRSGVNLFQNFTYFLNNPVSGDQLEQYASRWTSGGKIVHRRLGHVLGYHTEQAIGFSVRNDTIDTLGLYQTINRLRTGTIRQDSLHYTTVSLFGQAEIEWLEKLRTTLGGRADLYRYQVAAQAPANSGKNIDVNVSPKFTAVLGPWKSTELYLNYGTGFHTNDPRTALTRVNPLTGAPIMPGNAMVPASGGEFGFRTLLVPRVQTTVAVWYLDLDSELVFLGDAGTTTASRSTHRQGIELVNTARLTNWLSANLDMSFSRARFTEPDPSGLYIPGSPNKIISGSLRTDDTKTVFGAINFRHFGERPLIEDASAMSSPASVVSAHAGFRLTDRLTIKLEAYNLNNSTGSDIDYYYTSRLPGEPFEGVTDFHFHPLSPRMGRIVLDVSF